MAEPRYQDDASRWGEQKAEVWSGYADWMFERKLLEKELDADRAFTNDFYRSSHKVISI